MTDVEKAKLTKNRACEKQLMNMKVSYLAIIE